ncbi:hypothetical protein GR160_10670 [Flavobacterium sp. Sd200]|uniref:hypothetical protein n=1 Tax=Flavobacterium sp. Sd200 TaxID=2692211 RepID=UPI00136F2849|nr:hypothetical protein [Flavobacterium sp. Sd200]MXN91689.1 hypothetical protein [Flavobacterium sp. Sd200]
MTTNEVARVYDTLLSAPGMDDAVRIDMKIPRKQLLVLNHILNLPDLSKASELLRHLESGKLFTELRELGNAFLEKSSLVEFNAKFITVHQENNKS